MEDACGGVSGREYRKVTQLLMGSHRKSLGQLRTVASESESQETQVFVSDILRGICRSCGCFTAIS